MIAEQTLLEYVIGHYPYKKTGVGAMIHCPFHHDTVSSMYVTDDYAYCFACGKGWNGYQFFRLLKVDGVIAKSKAPDAIVHKTRPPTTSIVNTAARILWQHPEKLSYFFDRGLKRSIIKKYKIGYFRPPISRCHMPRYTIPAWDENGKLVTVSYRQDPKIQYENEHPENKKYLTHPGTNVTLYNMQNIGSSEWFVYVGGQIDALTLIQHNIPTIGVMGEGIFKNEWSRLLQDKHIFILLDNDKTGIEGSRKIHHLLPNSTIVRWPENAPSKYDINAAYNDPFCRLNGITALLRCYGANV